MVLIIVIEGPDGAGKTTLAASLCLEFGLKMGERGVADRSRLYEVTVPDTFRALGEAVDGREVPKVWDRLFYSEFIYAPVVGREPEFKPQQAIHIEQLIEVMGCPIVLCLPPIEVVKENITQADQMKGVHENIDTIYQGYLQLWESLPSQAIMYDYTDPAADLWLAHIKSYIASYNTLRQERSW